MKNLKLTVRCQQKWQKLKNATFHLLRKRNPTILKCVPFCEQVELTKNFLNQYHPPWLMRLAIRGVTGPSLLRISLGKNIFFVISKSHFFIRDEHRLITIC